MASSAGSETQKRRSAIQYKPMTTINIKKKKQQKIRTQNSNLQRSASADEYLTGFDPPQNIHKGIQAQAHLQTKKKKKKLHPLQLPKTAKTEKITPTP